MEKVITLVDVNKRYKISLSRSNSGLLDGLFKRKTEFINALVNQSLEIFKGQTVGYIGPNGAGKSTTIKLIAGILAPDSGTINVFGLDPFKNRINNARNIGLFAGHRNQLWWDVSPMDSFLLLKEIYEIGDIEFRNQSEHLFDLLGIEEYINQPVRSLSLGQRTKCNLVASLLHNPQLLLLDEPTIGLDILNKRKLRKLIHTLANQHGITLVLASHDLSDVTEICERLVIIDNGKTVFDGTEGQLRTINRREKHLQVETIEKIEGIKLPNGAIAINSRSSSNEQYSLDVAFNENEVDIAQIIESIQSLSKINSLKLIETPIEDVIAEIYQKGAVDD